MYEYRAIVKKVVDGDTADVDIDLGSMLFLLISVLGFMALILLSLGHRIKKKRFMD